LNPLPDISQPRLGTRGSQLALWQAHAVAARLAESGGPVPRIVVIKTSGDTLAEAPLSEVGGKRLFVKEIEDALLRGDIDLAVHSSKDMPVELPDGLGVAAVLRREDPRDAIVLPASGQASVPESKDGTGRDGADAHAVNILVAELGSSPSIGTGSVRRIAQLVRLFPQARFSPVRGNLDTRLRKLDEGQFDAIILAAAGMRRLGLASRISVALPVDVCVPAPGQGIVAIEAREGDTALRAALARINDDQASAALIAERAVVLALGGGCQIPIGVLASTAGGEDLELVAAVVALDGSRIVRGRARGPSSEGAAIGARLAAQLISEGAYEILSEARKALGTVEGLQP
jgi:hydroxymethylbilane synthase